MVRSMGSSISADLPPDSYQRIIHQMLVILPDPVEKLSLLHRVLTGCRRIPSAYRLYPRWAEIALRKMVMEEAERIHPGSRDRARHLMAQGVIPTPKPLLWTLYQLRHIIVSTMLLLLVWGMSTAVAALFDTLQPSSAGAPRIAEPGPIVPPPLLPAAAAPPAAPPQAPLVKTGSWEVTKPPEADGAGVSFAARAERLSPEPSPSTRTFPSQNETASAGLSPDTHLPIEGHATAKAPEAAIHLAALPPETGRKTLDSPEKEPMPDDAARAPEPLQTFPDYLEQPIWLVDKTPEYETYSNRLQIITTHTVDHIPRRYLQFPRSDDCGELVVETTGRIAGILFHSSESDLFPFSPEKNSSIKRYTAALIRYIQRNKSYHYFIDRFGRVYRIVREDHAAHHAGHAIWADDQWYYLNLNHAFIGICFEGRDFETVSPSSSAGGKGSTAAMLVAKDSTSINEAQLLSGKELTDWLRLKYNISQQNCVPHGLVSINPRHKLIGHHLDLSHSFPFARYELSDKYLSPLPSIVDFGFTYDRYFERIFQGRPWPGVGHSGEILGERAKAQNIGLTPYRKRLQAKFDHYYAMEKALRDQQDEPFQEEPQPIVGSGSARVD